MSHGCNNIYCRQITGLLLVQSDNYFSLLVTYKVLSSISRLICPCVMTRIIYVFSKRDIPLIKKLLSLCIAVFDSLLKETEIPFSLQQRYHYRKLHPKLSQSNGYICRVHLHSRLREYWRRWGRKTSKVRGLWSLLWDFYLLVMSEATLIRFYQHDCLIMTEQG